MIRRGPRAVDKRSVHAPYVESCETSDLRPFDERLRVQLHDNPERGTAQYTVQRVNLYTARL